MREIKFRAKILGHVGYVYGTPFNQHFDKEFANKWFDSMHGFDENGEVINEYIEQETLSQFTGLYDKNNKEIYEGDICKTYNIDIGNLKDLVVFDCGSFIFQNDKKLSIELRGFKQDYIEVIGNIHENPELLE